MHAKRLLVGLILAAVLLLTAVVALAATTLTYSAAPGLAIPDSPGLDIPGVPVSSTIVVADTGMIQDLNVSLNITHTFNNDLIVTLTHVDTGTTVTLCNRAGGSGNNIIVTLDDSAAAALPTTSTPILGTFRPAQALAAFNGEDIQGTWRVTVQDFFIGDTGTFNTWGMEAQVGPFPAPVVQSATAEPRWIGWEPGDGRLNPDPAAPAAVYLRDGALKVYMLDDSAHGWEALAYPADDIAAHCAPAPAENTLIASEDGGRVRLYCLSTGEIQLNVFGGSVEVVYVWNALPGWRYQITYAFNTATGQEISRHVDYPK